MASSGSFNTSSYSNRNLLFEWRLAKQDVANNKSEISWSIKGSGSASGYYMSGNFKVLINEVAVYVSATRIKLYNGTIVAEGTTIIEHNADGSGAFRASAEAGIYTVAVNCSGSGSWELTTIPRASSVTAADANIESATTINVSRASSNFTHILRYAFGSLSGIIAGGVATNCGWSIPIEFYYQIPNSKSGKCTIYCDTYNGETFIGTKSTEFTVTVEPTINAPDVSAVIIDTNSLSTSLTGSSDKLIKFISKPKVIISANAKNSATIKSKKVICGDGKSATDDITFNSVESGKFVISATDSRGISNSIEYQLEIIEYIKLTLNPTFYRPQPTTGEIVLLFDGNYFNNSFGEVANELNLKYRYKEVGSDTEWSDYLTLNPIIVDNNYFSGEEPISLGSYFDYTKAFNFEIVASDKIISNLPVIKTVIRGKPIFDIGKDDFNINAALTVNGEVAVNGEKVLTENSTIKREICCNCVDGNSDIVTGSYIAFNKQKYNTASGKIKFNSNGLIDIDHDGYIKVSYTIWFYAIVTSARPWISLINYKTKEVYSDIINDNTSYYVTLSDTDIIIPVKKGDILGLSVNYAGGNGSINKGSGRSNSKMTIEIIE